MQRTNIYLSDEQQRVLSARARTEGISKAELIRRILDEALGLRTTAASRLEAVNATAGIWSDRTDEELAAIFRWRTDDRLERLGL